MDKIAVLKDLGVKFYKGKKIKALMIKGAAMNAECKLVKRFQAGDHVAYMGEVLEATADESVMPLVYHGKKFWKLTETVQKPPPKFLKLCEELVEKRTKK